MLSVDTMEKVDLSGINSLADVVNTTCQKFADKPAYTCLGKTHTFKEIDELSAAFAAYLQNYTALQPGDKIVIQLPNITQYPIAVYGATRAGLIIVNTNPLYTPREMLHQFNNSEAKAIVVLADLLPAIEKVVPQTGIETVITTHVADFLAPQKQAKTSLKSITLLDALAKGKNSQYTPLAQDIEQLAVLQYTGGTTGISKGAMLSHRNILANTAQIRSRIGKFVIEGEELFIAPLPIYHIYAFNVTLVLYFSAGSHSVLIPNPRDIAGFVNCLKGVPFTSFAGINTLFVGLCMSPDFQALDFSQLKLSISGGTALTSNAATTWKQVTECAISEGYGLSETAPVLTLNPPDNAYIGSIGLPVIETEIRLLDDLENDVAEGQPGELAVRGPQVMQGYWKSEAETAGAMTADNFLKTGDIAVKLDNGYYKIVDRKKDMVCVSGFNVYPNEIEDVLSSHPGILESAVVGVPSKRTGEAVKAFIVIKDNTVTEASIITHCKELLTAYKVPKQVKFVTALPKTAVGKVLRRELRDQ
ncbi:MAG: long-chain acyl-CoA synthetase [Moritella sp.]|jgi:long-chain acyl-CoA synthetase